LDILLFKQIIIRIQECVMPAKQVTISARISAEDAEFISRLTIDDAKTPSDKLRAIIAKAKERSTRQRDYTGTLSDLQELIQPVVKEIRKTEVENQIHSELLIRLAEWIPDTAAFLISSILEESEAKTNEKMIHIEQGAADRLVRLMESILQLAVTRRCACYDPRIMDRRLDSVLELFQIIMARK
jgi:signal transduction histidine kinase